MVGCCGQRSQNQNNGQKKKCDPRTNAIPRTNDCVPGGRKGMKEQGRAKGPHNEDVCHGTGERRRDLLDQLKIFLSEFDDKPCPTPPVQDTRPLGSYPEYLKKHCQSWMPPVARPPLITSVQTHEIRASSDYDKIKNEANEYVSFTDASPKKPVLTCDCVKRNGLQDRCPHPMCTPPTAQCKANNPGPCCPPSLGLAGPEAVLGAKGGQEPTPTQRSEYREAYSGKPQQANSYNNQYSQPLPNQFQTTYQQDFRDNNQQQQFIPHQHQQLQYTMRQHQQQPPPGMELVCVCQAPPSALPSGKKYLCCPLPQN